MKNITKNKLSKLTLAILGITFLSSVANASPNCTVDDTQADKIVRECTQATTSNTIENIFDLSKKEYELTIDNPNMVLADQSYNVYQKVAITNSDEHKVTINLNNFEKFSNSTSNPTFQSVFLMVENKVPLQDDAKVDFNINVNSSDSAEFTTSDSSTVGTYYGIASYRKTKGETNLTIDKVNFHNGSTAITAATAIHNVAYSSGDSNVIFNNGQINYDNSISVAAGIRNVFKYGSKENPSFELDSDPTAPGRVLTQFNNGKIIINSTASSTGIVTQVESNTTRDAKIEINGGEIYASNAGNSFGALLADESTIGNESFIEQNGGKVYAGGIIENDTWKDTAKNGLIKGFAINYGTGIALGKIHQNDGLIRVSGNGTVEATLFALPAATHIYAAKTEFVQGKDAQIKVTGTTNAGAILFATKEGNRADISGTIEADEFGLYTKSNAQQLTSISINDSAKIYANKAIYNNLGDSEVVIAKDATLGKSDKLTTIELDDGDDKLTFNGTNLEYVTELDGGLDTDTQNEFDTLKFNDYTNLDFAGKIKNWERIELANGTYRLTQDLEVGTGDSSQGIGGGLIVDNNAVLNIDKNNLEITGDLRNQNGVVDLRHSDNSNTNLTVSGNYHGGGKMLFNVSASSSNHNYDKLNVTGDVTGKTTVEVSLTNNEGVINPNGIKLVALSDQSTAAEGENSFELAKKVDIGAYEYNTITYQDGKGKKGFYLESRAKKPINIENGKSSTYIHSSTPSSSGSIPLLRKGIPAYVLNQQSHAHAIAGIYSTLHERMGEQRTVMNSENGHQSWVRIFANKNDLKTNGIEVRNQEFFEQFGWDFYTNKDRLVRAGVFATYAKINSKFTDTYRDPSQIHGRIDNDLGSIGLYHTAYNKNGSYLDTVVNANYIYSDYEMVEGGKQYAYGGSASLEGGSRFNYKDHYYFEPQAQLSYQFTQYLSFKDNKEQINKFHAQSLRPRIGFRLGYNNNKDSNLWFHANANLELMKTSAVEVGHTQFKADRAQKAWYDLGLNGQVQLSSSKVFYSSIFYKHSFKHDSFKEFGAKLGLRFTW